MECTDLYEAEDIELQSLALVDGHCCDQVEASTMTRQMFEDVAIRRVQMLVESCGNIAQEPVCGILPRCL